ncbi:Uncharacterized protein MSYG_2420 [Malassezia sympodialis ATCC 42132]|uniref:Uncharacterized protein n=1 Tax=Malassezia sympodialis (strain ATCC 42132) TaxID=1230383 RepID=A0A1M8A6T4_MALS4|nr:Uncharacterized protein MSYG_2420 [Malassezia sympodialis ATCC 42132]
MPAPDASADAVQQKSHILHAHEKGAAVRRAILSCLESSLSVVQALSATGEKQGVRALLRERDALAMQILQTQREIDYTRAKSASYLDELQDLRTWVAQRLNENRSGPVPNVPSQISLLRGVLTYTARASGIPWWNDPDLCACVLAMDGDLGPSGGSLT